MTSGKFGTKECLIDTELSCLPVLGVAKNGHCFVYCPVSGLHPPKIYQKLGGILLEKFISSRDGPVEALKQGKDENTCKKTTLLQNDSGKEGREDYPTSAG